MTPTKSTKSGSRAKAVGSPDPTEKCLIFVSRRLVDGNIANYEVRDAMNVLAADRIEFFNPDEIEHEEAGRLKRISKMLERANLFFLVLPKTPSSTEYDWPLWEAGWFRGLNDREGKRSICFIPKGGTVPDQISLHVKKVVVTEKNLTSILLKLYKDKEFTNTTAPLNPLVDEAMVAPLAKQMYLEFIKTQEEHVDYGNPWIQLVLSPGSKAIEDGTPFRSNADSLKRLFDLPRRPPLGGSKELWTWVDLEPKISLGESDPGNFNKVWTKQLKEEVRTHLKGVDTVEQITARFLSHSGELFRPEIEEYRTTGLGMKVLVTFSEQVQDSWLTTAKGPVALAANIALASRIRYELILPFRKKVRRWKREDSIRIGLQELEKLAAVVERQGFFIAQMTQENLLDLFEHFDDEFNKLHHLWEEYGGEIKPRMEAAIKAADIEEARTVLGLWDKNNLEFLEIAIKRYQAELGLAVSA